MPLAGNIMFHYWAGNGTPLSNVQGTSATIIDWRLTYNTFYATANTQWCPNQRGLRVEVQVEGLYTLAALGPCPDAPAGAAEAAAAAWAAAYCWATRAWYRVDCMWTLRALAPGKAASHPRAVHR